MKSSDFLKGAIKFFGSFFIMPVIAIIIFYLLKAGVDLSKISALLPLGLVALVYFMMPKFSKKADKRETSSVVDYTIHAADIDRDECM